MDIFSKIHLSATGADQVLRETAKVEKGFSKVKEAGKDIFGRVREAGLGVGREIREFFAGAETKNREDRRESNERERSTRNLGGRGFEGGVRTGAGMAEQLAGPSDTARAWGTAATRASEIAKSKAENYRRQMEESTRLRSQAAPEDATMKSVGTGLTRAGATMPYTLGVALAAGGVALNLISTLAHKELERASAIWASGMAQRLNESYNDIRTMRISRGREGIPTQAVDAYLNAVSQVGGNVQDQMRARSGMIAAMNFGVDPSLMGRLQGLRQQAGFGGIEGSTVGMAERSFGRGMMGRFITVVSSAIEDGMSRGMRKGSAELAETGKQSARLMTAFARPEGGKLTPTGAAALAEGVQQKFGEGGAGINTPEELQRFFMFHRPGESYLETMKKVRGPRAFQEWFKMQQKRYGADRESLQMSLISNFPGMSPWQQEALFAGGEYLGRMEGKKLPGERFKMPTALDQRGAGGIVQAFQQQVLEKEESKSVSLLSSINTATMKVHQVAEAAVAKLDGLLSEYAKKADTNAPRTDTKRRLK